MPSGSPWPWFARPDWRPGRSRVEPRRALRRQSSPSAAGSPARSTMAWRKSWRSSSARAGGSAGWGLTAPSWSSWPPPARWRSSMRAGRPTRSSARNAHHHAPTRMGVRLAREEDGCTVVAEAADAASAVDAAIRERPDVCLLDVSMPGGGGIAATREIKAALEHTAVVLLTVSDDDEDLFAALAAGIDGYLLKTMAADRLGPTLRAVAAGEA